MCLSQVAIAFIIVFGHIYMYIVMRIHVQCSTVLLDYPASTGRQSSLESSKSLTLYIYMYNPMLALAIACCLKYNVCSLHACMMYYDCNLT